MVAVIPSSIYMLDGWACEGERGASSSCVCAGESDTGSWGLAVVPAGDVKGGAQCLSLIAADT